jgi:hypothetical protein
MKLFSRIKRSVLCIVEDGRIAYEESQKVKAFRKSGADMLTRKTGVSSVESTRYIIAAIVLIIGGIAWTAICAMDCLDRRCA